MRTFPIKVHYKVIEILAVRWLGTKLMLIFKETTTSDEKLAGRSPGNDDEVSVICFPHKLDIVLNEARILYTVEKGFILQSKGAHF